MYKVQTHNNSKEYFKNLHIEENAIYITANTSLSNMIKETSVKNDDSKWQVLDIENFIAYLYPSWTNVINIIKLQDELRKEIIGLRETTLNEEDLKELKFLEDNISTVYSDFRYIVESGVRKLSYSTNNVKLRLFKEIFNSLSEKDIFKSSSEEILDINKAKDFPAAIADNYLRRLSTIDKDKAIRMKSILGKKSADISKVYFYNINNLDLRRYMVVELLKYAGFEIVFRIPYYKNLNVVNKCWDMVYKDSELFNIEINEEEIIPHKSGVKYIDFLQGNEVQDKIEENVIIKNYREVYDYKKIVKGNNIITLNKDSLHPIMERDKLNLKNHCYQNSIGRFLFNIYNCDIRDGKVKITYDTYRELITSGWLEAMKWNGIKLHSYLIENEEYFAGVTTLEEILERIEKLKEIAEVSNIFEERSKDKIKKNPTKQFLSNPFRAFEYANFEKYNITANYMYEVTSKLRRFILKAFESDNNMINVEEHFNMLRMLFKNNYIIDIYKNGSESQQKIVKRIFAILNNPSSFGTVIHKDSFKELFNVYLAMDNDHLLETEQENDFSIDQLEGLIYRDKIIGVNKGVLYIGDLSYKAYEMYIDKFKSFNKVLTSRDMEFIFKESLKGRNKEIAMEGLKLQQISNKAGESYLKFTLANLFINYDGPIEFSWIEGLRKNDSKAILLKQIEAIYGKSKDVTQYLDKDEFIEDEYIEEIDKYVYDINSITKEVNSIPEVAFRDLDFCGDKFLYSSILEGNPSYCTDFHQRLAFSSLISIFKNNIEDGYISLLKFVLPLFPQWQEVVKKNILDCEFSRKGLREYRYFEGINYPKSIDTLYLLKSKYIVTENNKIRNRYNKGEFNGERYYKEFIKEYIDNEQNNNGLHCRMCPHIYLCKKGEFVIDRK